MKTPKDLITLEQTLKLVGLTASGWRNARNSRHMPEITTYRLGREVFFSKAEVQAWIKKRAAAA